jgi:hypothetical protein
MNENNPVWGMLKERAAASARSNGCARIKDISPATLEGLREAIAQAIISEMNAVALQQELIARFSLPSARALMIARTELSGAFSRAYIELISIEGIDLNNINLASSAAHELYASGAPAVREKLTKRVARARLPKQAKESTIDGTAKTDQSGVLGVNFDLSNEGLIKFVRSYHFAESADHLTHGCLARRRAARDLRGLLLRGLTEGWSHNRLRDAVDVIFACGLDLANHIASDETNRAANAAALASFIKNGITLKVWVCMPDACERCRALDGKTISIANNFSGGVPFPPLHMECHCAIRGELE